MREKKKIVYSDNQRDKAVFGYIDEELSDDTFFVVLTDYGKISIAKQRIVLIKNYEPSMVQMKLKIVWNGKNPGDIINVQDFVVEKYSKNGIAELVKGD